MHFEGSRPTTFQENPKFTQMVKDGTLPPLNERMPIEEHRLVLDVVDEIGVYGGTWTRVGPNYILPSRVMNRGDCVLEDYDHATYRPYSCLDFEQSEDGRSWSFKLRDGMKWNDGVPITMEDYRFAWEDLNYMESVPGAHPEVYNGWGSAATYLDPITGNSPTFNVVNDNEFSIDFDSPHYQFMVQLRHTRSMDCRFKCFFSPKHYMKEFHPKYADAADLTKLIQDGGHNDWTDMFLSKQLTFADEIAVPQIAAMRMTDGAGRLKDRYVFEANPYYFAVDPMGNQLPYTDGSHMTIFESREVAVFRAMAGENDHGAYNVFDILELPMYQSNMEKGDYSLYNWGEPGNHGVLTFNFTFNEDPEIGYWMRTADFRRALSYVIDREAWNEVLHLGLGTVMANVPPVGASRWAPAGDAQSAFSTYDLSTANKMLDELGLVDTDGDGIRNRTGVLGGGTGNLELYAEVGTSSAAATRAQLILESLGEVGIQFDFKVNVNYYVDLRADQAYLDVVTGATGVMNLNPYMDEVVSTGGHIAPGISKWMATAGLGSCEFPACQQPTGGRSDVLPMAPDNTWPADSNGVYMQLWEMKKEGRQFPNTHPENNRIGAEMWAMWSDQQYKIGSVSFSPARGIYLKRNNFRNIPKQAAPYYDGNYSELYYFEDGIDNRNHPGNKSKKYKSESFLTGLSY
jgi:peptide/nickel transport system substrate-binding protein